MILFLPQSESGDLLQTPPQEQPVHGQGQILVVDDEAGYREMLAEMLGQLGYSVTCCGDGKAAIALYRQNWRSIDLVILDMIMPELDGRDTYLALRQINRQARVILSSGFSTETDLQQLLDLGQTTFLCKPYRLQELSEKTAAALRQPAPP